MITAAERRARLANQHRVVDRSGRIEDVVDDLVVLHATDPATIYLALHARTEGVTVGDIDEALFERRSMMRTLAMRRTLFVATAPRLPVIECSSSIDVALSERKVLEKAIASASIPQPTKWLDAAFTEVLDVLDGEGLPARSLTKVVPRLATKIVVGGGKHTQKVGATSRVLGLMAVEGMLARGRPAGNWTGRQYEWRRRDQWIPLVDDPPAAEEAAVELLRLYIGRFGPVTMTDLKWWTGWTATKTKKALAALKTVEEVDVEIDMHGSTATGLMFSDETFEPDPWVALLPALDPTAMGWKDRSWYIGEHTAQLFDRNGNIGPTIWVDGQIVGVWAQNVDGEIVTDFLTTLSPSQRKQVKAEGKRVAAFLGDVVVKPSFPTPRQKALAAGISAVAGG